MGFHDSDRTSGQVLHRFYPAAADSKFAGKGYDPGCFTPLPGTRGKDFLYDLNNADPAMILYDYETLRDTVINGEAFTFYNRYGAIPLLPRPNSRCRTRPSPSESRPC